MQEYIRSLSLPDLFTFENGDRVNCLNAQKRRDELFKIMQREVFGFMPGAPESVTFECIKHDDKRCCGGKAVYKRIRASLELFEGRKFSFEFQIMLPKLVSLSPFVVIANFRSCLPDEYIPAEELIDRGVGFAVFCYKTDVTTDDDDFSNGLAGVIYPDGKRKSQTDCGKIAMWAYCMSIILDYAFQNESIDKTKIASAGHSRLGKTALLAAASDTRFTHAFSNNSGCSGAAISRGNSGETIDDITKAFPFWFCEGYKRYAGNELSDNKQNMPFDQHFLVAAIAPRSVYIASAIEDTWADPRNEFINCVVSAEFWKLFGYEKPFVECESLPRSPITLHGDKIGYHLRSGVHYLSRYDWDKFLQFFLK